MFKANIEEKNDHLLVKLIGDLDVYSKEDFSKFCDESLKNTDTDFIIDLEKLDYIDSTGLGMFINIYKDQKEKDKSVKIINPKENLMKVEVIGKDREIEEENLKIKQIILEQLADKVEVVEDKIILTKEK